MDSEWGGRLAEVDSKSFQWKSESRISATEQLPCAIDFRNTEKSKLLNCKRKWRRNPYLSRVSKNLYIYQYFRYIHAYEKALQDLLPFGTVEPPAVRKTILMGPKKPI